MEEKPETGIKIPELLELQTPISKN